MIPKNVDYYEFLNSKEKLMTIEVPYNGCITPLLVLYENEYVLLNSYQGCKSGSICLSMLKYTGGIKSYYNENPRKFLENAKNMDDDSITPDLKVLYEINTSEKLIREGYGYSYIIQKPDLNLENFLSQNGINLDKCAKVTY